jgi:phage tail tape-measure protein
MAYGSWFETNTSPNPGALNGARWDAHVWGRQQFAKSFARGGFASTVLAPSRTEMLISPWRRKQAQGSPEYSRRLRMLQSRHPGSSKIAKAIEAAKSGKAGGLGSSLMGGGLMAAFIALPAITTQGPLAERARAVTSGLGAFAGWEVGSKVGTGAGAATGATIGALLGPIGTVVGGIVGGVAGWAGGGMAGSMAGEELTDALTRIPDRMVDRERSRRNLDWGTHTKAFQTRRAHTMRQQSLAAMNRGQMSARSLLGQEAVFVHR